MSRVVSVLRFVEWLWRHRVFRGFFWCVVGLWVFDRTVYVWTEYQWFASLGFQNLWRARVGAQIFLFTVFLLVCWGLAHFFLGAVTRFHAEGPPLRGALSQVEPLRRRVSDLAWGLTGAVALLLAWQLTSHWSDWLFLRGGSSSRFSTYGIKAGVWTHFLPVFAPFLSALWLFSLCLLGVVALTGILRALPLLAARDRPTPLLLPRVLWRLVAWLLLLRGAAYLVQIFNLNRGRPLQSGDLYILLPLFLIGVLACFGLIPLAAQVPPRKSRLPLSIGVALVLPELLFFLSTPLRSWWGETGWVKVQRINATRAAWGLNHAEMTPFPAAPSVEAAWPVWDENSLLQTRRSAAFHAGKRLVTWRRATLLSENGHWGAVMVGESADAKVWNADPEANESTQLALDKVRFEPNGTISQQKTEAQSAYYGFEGRVLFSNQPIGVPIGNWINKFLWAWRLRDVLLPFEGAKFSYLLVFRGARERAARLAPFWAAGDEPQLVMDGPRPVWMLDLCTVSADFPGALPVPSGTFQGANAANDAIKMLLDARTGAVSFVASRTGQEKGWMLSSWMAVLPNVVRAPSQISPTLHSQLRPSPLLVRAQAEMENALAGRDNWRVLEPQQGFDREGGCITRVVSLGRERLSVLEAWPNGERFRREADGNGEARLRAIDDAVSRAAPQSNSVQMGVPYFWPDGGAPGGWWVGRAFFDVPDNKVAHLWRVALTGLADNSPVGVGVSPQAARSAISHPPSTGKVASRIAAISLEVQAIRAHEAVQEAARRGDWPTFQKASAQLRSLLEKMAARGRSEAANPLPQGSN